MQKGFCSNPNDLKKFFRKSVKVLHPDLGGDPQEFLRFLEWYRGISKEIIVPKKVEVAKYQSSGRAAFFKTIELSIKEAALGLRKNIKLPLREITCTRCQGSGKESNSSKEPCSICSGEGFLKFSLNGKTNLQKCSFCSGRGYHFKDSCPLCLGKGKLREEAEVEINIPLGLKEGDILFISGSTLDTKWDFYLEVELEKHPYWKLEGRDLHYELKIPFFEIMLEEFLEIETLEGKEKIPTSLFTKGEPVILPRRGPFLPDGSLWKRGDLIVHLKPLFPESISSRAKRYLERFKNILLEEENGGACISCPQRC